MRKKPVEEWRLHFCPSPAPSHRPKAFQCSLAGTDSVEVAATDLEHLYAVLEQVLGPDMSDQLRAENVRVAVNQDIVSANTTLRAGDEVAFLPPVTGG